MSGRAWVLAELRLHQDKKLLVNRTLPLWMERVNLFWTIQIFNVIERGWCVYLL